MTNGILKKMRVEHLVPIAYHLELLDSVAMNQFIGREIELAWTGKIVCTSCGKNTKKSFGQGFCYTCFVSAPEASPCIISPELCKAHLGEGRDPEWEERHHNCTHIVYLAKSDAVKVGVTRKEQIPVRWIDQGAHSAIILAETPNRYTAGLIEVALKSIMSDKTNWQRMLKNEINHDIDLVDEKGQVEDMLPRDLRDYISDNDEVYEFSYPVSAFPSAVKSTGFDKSPVVRGTLAGIKGQYLIFTDNRVINLRKHSSYEISFTIFD